MRLFLANSSEKQNGWLRTTLQKARGSDLSLITHTPALAWDDLPEHCIVESDARATAALLNQLQQHAFKIVVGVSNPLNIFAAHSSRAQTNSSALTNDIIREHLLRGLEWSHIDGVLVLRHEDWAFSRDSEIERLRHHCGERTGTQFTDHTHAHAQLASHEEPDFWRSQIPAELALKIHDAHAVLFAALGYFAPPIEENSARPHSHPQASRESAEIVRLRHQLRGLETTQRRLRGDLRAMRQHRAKTITELVRLNVQIEAGEGVTWRYHRLVHGVGVGKHLYRAWKVLSGDRHYIQPPLTPKSVGGELPLPDHLKGYQSLTFGDLEVRFHLEALHDKRGIGRVATQLLNGLKALQTPPAPSSTKASTRVVHFFPASHWGPEKLPERSCVLVHDVIPLITPDYPKASLHFFEKRVRITMSQAAKIITISAASARDIARVLHHPAEKISVIHNGVTSLQVSKNPVTQLPAEPFVVYVGGGDIHKNLGILFEALCRPAAQHVHLVMIGANQHYSTEVANWGLGERVHFLGHIPDEEVGYALQKAKAFVFPSFYEGFGLPPLEAALLGTPSICSRRPAMTELLAGAALFADPECADDWAACLHLVTTRPEFAREIGQLARAKAERLQWDATCRAYLNEFRALA